MLTGCVSFWHWRTRLIALPRAATADHHLLPSQRHHRDDKHKHDDGKDNLTGSPLLRVVRKRRIGKYCAKNLDNLFPHIDRLWIENVPRAVKSATSAFHQNATFSAANGFIKSGHSAYAQLRTLAKHGMLSG